jgi:hypothetical protein
MVFKKIIKFIKKRKNENQIKGKEFELRVKRIYQNLGKFNVKHDVKLYDKNGNESQIDVVYGLFFKTYIECKNYSKTIKVDPVSKFMSVLQINRIPLHRGIFITSSDYVDRIKDNSQVFKIKIINGEELNQLEKYSIKVKKFRALMKVVMFFIFLLYVYNYEIINQRVLEYHDSLGWKWSKKYFYAQWNEFYDKIKKNFL